jgi:hypothetical protein
MENSPKITEFNGHPVAEIPFDIPYYKLQDDELRRTTFMMKLKGENKLKNLKETTNLLRSELEKNGWCFVLLSPELVKMQKNLLSSFSEFFGLAEGVKKRSSGAYGFGYSAVPHKEGVRILTGERLQKFEKRGLIPGSCKDPVRIISDYLDDTLLMLVTSIAEIVFRTSTASVGRLADIPIAYWNSKHIGMLDIAHYFNDKTTETPPPFGESTEEVNCVPHFDPGLLSLSFLSTTEGLQLFDADSKSWVNGPINTIPGQENIGVIWLGQAAVKVDQTLKAGVHRVTYPKVSTPRITSWYEICTVKQVSKPEERNITSNQVSIPNLVYQPFSYIWGTLGQSVTEILATVERTRGIPRSKVMSLDEIFKAWDEKLLNPKEGDTNIDLPPAINVPEYQNQNSYCTML